MLLLFLTGRRGNTEILYPVNEPGRDGDSDQGIGDFSPGDIGQR